ncbi:hypothetical protein ANN_00159 [Periplaneta americana]|uniref:HAT C-terminal dimerisation domain-containing protein n=1 Tax=Periplaneta americana TaxID=6978 RepID=A0ABQ8TPZ8_PERAM|nr:hypothetical protein ANN_00159 [Periplaneta americana]
MPKYLKWGTYISYLRYGLEGYVSAIYGYGREVLDCVALYCHYKFPHKFLNEITMTGDQFWNDILALCVILLILSELSEDRPEPQMIPTRCNEIIFPCTRKALKLFCTLPVTTATSDRSFSTLRYLKTYLRSTMGADRLNGLALMYIHKNVEVKAHEVLDEMSKKPRRLLL